MIYGLIAITYCFLVTKSKPCLYVPVKGRIRSADSVGISFILAHHVCDCCRALALNCGLAQMASGQWQ